MTKSPGSDEVDDTGRHRTMPSTLSAVTPEIQDGIAVGQRLRAQAMARMGRRIGMTLRGLSGGRYGTTSDPQDVGSAPFLPKAAFYLVTILLMVAGSLAVGLHEWVLV